jgi:heme-degrading monooxygenase HmoA
MAQGKFFSSSSRVFPSALSSKAQVAPPLKSFSGEQDLPHLAQLNLARLKAPKGDPLTEEFFQAIAPINALAEAHPGFVWRLVGDVKDHTDLEFFLDPHLVVNISIWKDLESFKHFVYKSGHVQYIKRKREWMDPFQGPYAVMWWVDEGHIPDLVEAKARLDTLEKNGPTAEAFDYRNIFDPSGNPAGTG